MSRLIFWLPAVVCLLSARPALAQKDPPTLLGRWQTRHIGFSFTGTLPDTLFRQLDNADVASLNQAIFSGEALLVVNFNADSTYDFTIVRDGETARTEAGTFTIRQGRLLARSPGSADGSSFHDQQVLRLTRRDLVLAFPAGPVLPGVTEEVEYRRVGPVPR